MKILLIVVLTLGCTHGATVWNQTDESDFVGPSVYAPNSCTFHIKSSFYQNMIFLDMNGQVKQPDKNGKITVNKNVEIAVSCSEEISYGILIKCMGNDKFKTPNDKQYVYSTQLQCEMDTQPKLKTIPCLNTKKLIEIGFKNWKAIVGQIDVCFDDTTKQTLYAKMTMSKEFDGSQSQSSVRPFFKADRKFITKSIHTFYNNQQDRFQTLLGKKLGDEFTVGHLAAWADFPYTQQRLLTMFYVNTAPQWKAFNEGNWNELEKRIRSIAKSNDYDVYTGTYGILQLADNNGNNVDMYLSPPPNINHPIQKYLVPKYFWKVLIEKTKKPNEKAKGIAFIGRNNVIDPFIPNEDTLCTNVMQKITWLNSNPNPNWENHTIGRIIACEVNDFNKIILWQNDLPNFPAVPGGLPINSL